MVLKFIVELELSEPLTKQSSEAVIGNSIANGLCKWVFEEGLVPNYEEAVTQSVSVLYHENGGLVAYRKVTETL